MELGPDGMGLVPDRMRPALEGMRSDKIDWIRQSKRGPYVYKASQLASQLALSSLALNIRSKPPIQLIYFRFRQLPDTI